MASIFLSYAREDRRFAEKLAQVLEEAGHGVWWDRHIDGGEEFAAEIEAQLDKAEVVLVAWSKDSVRSRWVRDEAATGGDSGRLVPVSVDGSRPPMGFRQFHTIDLAGWRGAKRDERTAELLHSVERRLDGKLAAPPNAAPAPARLPSLAKSPARRKLWSIGALVMLLVGAGIVVALLRSSETAAEPASLAVLPFKNIAAGDPYFAEGVAEEIANQLSREPQFRVAGRTSSALFKDAADFRDVGRRLHVAYVLEGSVRSAGQQVRVNVALVDTRKGLRLWDQDFRGSLNDIFAIQDSIGKQVASHVKRQLISAAASPTMKTSGDVYALYVTARSLMRQREPGKLDAAVDLLKRAVQTDPSYAPAWARLGLAEQLSEFYSDKDPLDSSRAQQVRYVEHAIALAPELADGHAILGLFLGGTLDAQESRRALEELEAAVRLDPGNAEAWYWLSSRRSADLDFAGALDALRHTVSIDPFFVHSQHLPPLAWAMGYRQEAGRVLENSMENNPDPFMREIARSQFADVRNDLSGAYEHAKIARDIAGPDVKEIAENRMGDELLRVGLLNEAERYVPLALVDLRRGKLIVLNGFREAFPRAREFWKFNSDEDHLLPRLLVKAGHWRELVSVYDEAFTSPADMARRHSHYGFVLNAPLLAISLRKAGRGHEGVQILFLADAMCDKAVRTKRSPASFRVMCSRVWALIGRNEEAIRTLEQTVSEGWRPSEGEYQAVTDEPAFGAIHNDPRLKRIDAIIAADIARERRELLAAGL